MSIERKKVRTKKWSAIYCEKTAREVDDPDPSSQANLDFLASMWARTMLAKVLSKRIKSKIRSKAHSCKKSLLNLHKPSDTSNWESHWGSQLMCDICHCPAIYDSIVCCTCDVIVHISCVDNDLETEHEVVRQEATDEEEESMELVCAHCKSHRDSEYEYFHKELKRLKDDRHLRLVLTRITAAMRTYITRVRYLRQRRVAIAMQAYLRRRIVRKRFTQMRRNQTRVVVLDIVSLPNIDKASMVIWTVVDKFKNHQLFRQDREISKSVVEGFLIPGTSSNVSVFISIIRTEGQNFIMAAQAQLALRDVDPYGENQIHTLVMSDSIQWLPQETRVEKMNIQLPRNTVIDDVDEFGEPIVMEPPVETKHLMSCKIRYNALSTVTSFCASIHGPPLDVLRKPAEIYQMATRNNAAKNGGVPERKTKWWLCFAEMHLLFYQYFGDTKPRFAVHIGDATATLARDTSPVTHVTVLFNDKRKWTLEFDTPHEAKRFVFAVSETKKAVDGSSIFFKKPRQFRTRLLT